MLTRKGIDAMYKAYKRRRKKRRGASDDEADASADEGRADPGTAESDQTASAAEGTLGRGSTRRAAGLNRLWRTRHQTTQGRRRCTVRRSRLAQGETREGAGRCGDQQEDVRRD